MNFCFARSASSPIRRLLKRFASVSTYCSLLVVAASFRNAYFSSTYGFESGNGSILARIRSGSSSPVVKFSVGAAGRAGVRPAAVASQPRGEGGVYDAPRGAEWGVGVAGGRRASRQAYQPPAPPPREPHSTVHRRPRDSRSYTTASVRVSKPLSGRSIIFTRGPAVRRSFRGVFRRRATSVKRLFS